MFTLIMLAICVPLVAVAAHFVVGEKHPKCFADVRGIALQTVIIIVVLLAIAGSVAGVLLTRAGDVTSQLESQEAVPGLVTSGTTCTAHLMVDIAGAHDSSASTCTWTEGTTTPVKVTKSRCDLVRGTHAVGASNTTCVVQNVA